MHVTEQNIGDIELPKEKARKEKNAKQRDRYRAVASALEQMQTTDIMKTLDRNKNFVQRWVYIFGAVNPVNGKSSAMIAPTVNTDYMNVHLRFISEGAGDDVHVVLVLDRAGCGWHTAKKLKVPENITLMYLPAYSPKLNPIE